MLGLLHVLGGLGDGFEVKTFPSAGRVPGETVLIMQVGLGVVDLRVRESYLAAGSLLDWAADFDEEILLAFEAAAVGLDIYLAIAANVVAGV